MDESGGWHPSLALHERKGNSSTHTRAVSTDDAFGRVCHGLMLNQVSYHVPVARSPEMFVWFSKPVTVRYSSFQAAGSWVVPDYS